MKQQVVDHIRMLSAEAIQNANSGHPGLPLGAAPMAFELWSEHMKHNPKNPKWINRDRFILSAGHGSAMLYSLLHLFGYDLSMEELKNFRQLNSKTPGHPEYGHTAGVEISTGPLGQGIANGVGFAMAEAHLAAQFNREISVIDHHTYVLTGDGCLMEGISYEAASIAGSFELGKLIVLYDSNDITIEGRTGLTFTENIQGRFEAMNWQYLRVEDGTDMTAIGAAIDRAKLETKKPTIIEIKTVIGNGCPPVAGTAKAHGAPLGADGMKALYETLGVQGREPFTVDSAVSAHMSEVQSRLQSLENDWNQTFAHYAEKYPDLAKSLEQWMTGDLPFSVQTDDFYRVEEKGATRSTSGKLLNLLSEQIPNLFGGSADLAPSNNSNMNARGHFGCPCAEDRYIGSNVHFGIREHAMAAIVNGMCAHGGVKPYAATFFVFADYMKPAMRLAALMKLPVTYILTHDSIGVGEDGPTHQPIDQLAMLRAIPNFNVVRPADSREVGAAWEMAMTSKETPTAIVLTRQNLPLLEGSSRQAMRGAYVISPEKEEAELVLIATGSEVSACVEAQSKLAEMGIDVRVVSMPSFHLFEQQDEEYQLEVLGYDIPRMSVEAASTFGWMEYADIALGIDEFGQSAPGNALFRYYGMDAQSIADFAKEFLEQIED
ncbi:MAG: transketolase [Bacillota bacterium]|nr:transketolase [Bacillota bacterium]